MSQGALFFAIYSAYLSRIAFGTGSYEAFRSSHGRDAVADDTVSFEARQQLFEQRKAEVLAHNSLNKSWTMVVNHFSDYTDEELRRMLGYKRVGGRWGQSPASGGSSFLQADEYGEDVDNEVVAAEVDWRQNLMKTSTWVRNQGACGSCWAVAAVGAMEMHNEKRGNGATRLSVQQAIDCVPNPRHCGGTGGCQGATGELLFEYSRTVGLVGEDQYSSGMCNSTTPSVKLTQFIRLPENEAKYLHHAVATKGPIVVSVDGGNWFGYGGGVFSGCQRDTVVNHAVLNVGYGKDTVSGKDYWLVRNSWGPEWGEKGYLRIERHMQDRAYCGTDNKPKDGVFCDDAPATVEVCGMCGIYSDSAYPIVASQSNPLRHHRRIRKATRYWGDASPVGAGAFAF